MIVIQAQKRSKTDRLDNLRSNGKVPGVVYGASTENTSIVLDKGVFEKTYKQAGQSSTVILDLDGKKIDVLIHEVQYHPVIGHPMHVDFLAVDANKETELAVPIEFIGVSPAVKNSLGNLVKVTHELEIRALPKDIPHTIQVDIETLTDLDSQITAGDIVLPKGVTLVTKKDDILAAIAAQKEETENTPVDIKDIEVEKKGKKEVSE